MKSFKLFSEENVSEALTNMQRRKRSKIMQMKSAIIARKRERAMNKKAPREKLLKRAMLQARGLIKNKIIKGREEEDLSYSQKEKIEKMVDKKKGIIKRIAKKLLPKIKVKETERIKRRRSSQ
jgi:hypothetical protein